MQNIIKTAVIFAGGKSSRMGQDKALLPFGDAPTLTQYQYKRLSQIFESVYISAKSHKFDFECQVIEDQYDDASPLVALLSVFETLDVEKVFILSVDTPFVNTKVIHTLINECEQNVDIVVAKHVNNLEPLSAIYDKSILPLLKKHYQEKNHKMHNLLKNAKTKIVHFDEDTAFMNLNYYEDYEKALETKA
jgi:molybdopterin-guanine dinucleotide biosynthesis protein A